jgi:hypothetical protein
VWKRWSVNIDEFFFQSPTYDGGWSSAKDPDPNPVAARRPAAQNAQNELPAGHLQRRLAE